MNSKKYLVPLPMLIEGENDHGQETDRRTTDDRQCRQALAFAQGENNAGVVHIPREIDTARIRKKIKMSQSKFAAYFGVSVRTVQEWEQGRVVPSGAARAFLVVIDREPDAVRRALVDFAVRGNPEHLDAVSSL